MKKSVAIAISLAGLLGIHAGEAHACRGPQWERATILQSLPPAAAAEEMVGKIEVVELIRPDVPYWPPDAEHTYLAKVRVVEPIKGLNMGQVLTVSTGGTSCDRLFSPADVGRTGYIAGGLDPSAPGEPVFVGPWDWQGRKAR